MRLKNALSVPRGDARYLRKGSRLHVSEKLLYTDTINRVIGPLSERPFLFDEVDLFAYTGILQEYQKDYTVREVTGGTTPGFFICLSPTSNAPGGGWFNGGSNPSTGLHDVLEYGDILRAMYPASHD